MIEVITPLTRDMELPTRGRWNITVPYCADTLPKDENDPLWNLMDEEIAIEKRLLYGTRYFNGFETHDWEIKKTWEE